MKIEEEAPRSAGCARTPEPRPEDEGSTKTGSRKAGRSKPLQSLMLALLTRSRSKMAQNVAPRDESNKSGGGSQKHRPGITAAPLLGRSCYAQTRKVKKRRRLADDFFRPGPAAGPSCRELGAAFVLKRPARLRAWLRRATGRAPPLRAAPSLAVSAASGKRSGALSALQDAAQGQLQSGGGDGLFQPRGRPENSVKARRVGGITGDREKGDITRGQFFRELDTKSVLQLDVEDRRIGIVGVQPPPG